MKKFLSLLLTVIILLENMMFCFALDCWKNPYSDVKNDMWFYDCISNLCINGIIKDTSTEFLPETNETRGNVLKYLYEYYKMLGGKWENTKPCKFSDVYPTAPYYDAVCYATENNIASGVEETLFDPDASCTKEQVCAFVMRFAKVNNLQLKKKKEPIQFVDSLNISDYARSYVVACKMAGIINGNENNWFIPWQNITKAEACAIVYSLICAGAETISQTDEAVDITPGAYDSLYNNYKPIFCALVPYSEPVDKSFFDDCGFVGDSVTLRLKYYCASNKALSNTTFLCSGSLSASNALWEVSEESVHPSFMGEKMTIEDCVKKSGIKKVYIMLGINSLSEGVDVTVDKMHTVINNILAKSPDVKIIMQSVTPMERTSNILSGRLNNSVIDEYNSKICDLCQENGWYYINVSEVMKDSQGYLISSYCSDKNGMGIHFTSQAAECWINYLKTHVPAEFK